MGVLDILTSLRTPALLLLTVFGPSLLPRLLQLLGLRKAPPSSRPTRPRRPLTSTTKLLLLLSSAYWLYLLLVPPFDLFTHYRIPITSTQETLRRILLPPSHSSGSPVPTLRGAERNIQEILSTKLANLDYRLLYARFGHDPLVSCQWCRTREDYLLASLPGILRPYLLTGLMIGIMGWRRIGGVEAGARADRWRSAFGWALCALGAAEVGTKCLWDLRVVEGDCLHLASTTHTLRTSILLVLPLAYCFLPLSPAPSAHLATLLPGLSNIAQTLRLHTIARQAIFNSPSLQSTYAHVAEEQSRDVAYALADPSIADRAAALGLTREALGPGARQWIQMGWNGVMGVPEERLRPP